MAAYGAPAMIYLFCPRDALAGDGRGKWTLRKWSLPAAFLATLFTSVFMVSSAGWEKLRAKHRLTPCSYRSCSACLPAGQSLRVSSSAWSSREVARTDLSPFLAAPVNASYAAAILAGVPLLGSIAWVFYGNGGLHPCFRVARRLTPLFPPPLSSLRRTHQNHHTVDYRRRGRPSSHRPRLSLSRHEGQDRDSLPRRAWRHSPSARKRDDDLSRSWSLSTRFLQLPDSYDSRRPAAQLGRVRKRLDRWHWQRRAAELGRVGRDKRYRYWDWDWDRLDAEYRRGQSVDQ